MAWREAKNIFDKKKDEVYIRVYYADSESFFDKNYFSTIDSLSDLLHSATAMEGNTLQTLHNTVKDALDYYEERKGVLIKMVSESELSIDVHPALYVPYIHPIEGEA